MKNNFIIKICGIRSILSARTVIKQKPSMIGLIFVPDKIRSVDIETAKKISKLTHKEKILVVGVFQDQPIDQVLDTIRSVRLDYVQLHGNESSFYCKKIPVPIIKKITLKANMENTKIQMGQYLGLVDIFLIDRPKQSQGLIVNIDQIRKLAKDYRIIIAGGLTQNNVKNVVVKASKKLLGVDVSSGVEKIVGEKDGQLINSFIKNARGVYEQL